MSSPDLELQGAIVQRLKADTDLQAIIGNPIRLFQDNPPAQPTPFPYVTIGDSQGLSDQAECIDGSEIFVTIHIWSRANGFAEVKRIGGVIEDNLHDVAPSLNGHRCLHIQRANAIYRMAEDNATKHGILTLRALTEPTD